MDLNSTHLIFYCEIDVDEIDIYEDAMGLNTDFADVYELLGRLSIAPADCLTRDLIVKVRDQN